MKPISYIVENERDQLWGLAIKCVGYEKIGKGEKYPTDRHLAAYDFSPSIGRVLQEYQIVYITEGEGTFQSASVPETKITHGTMFLLFPGEWHTYKPDPKIGWSQMWIGFKGVNMEMRTANGFLSKNSPIFNVGVHEDVIKLFMEAITVAEQERAHYQIMLAGIVNHLLGVMYTYDRNEYFNKNEEMVNRINKARMIMLDKIESTVTIQEIAQELGMSYSSFRKQFKEYTGLSPASYFQDIKLQRAVELLRYTNMTIKEIAYLLNFESPDYFSTQFKKKMGKRPRDIREN